MTSLPPVGRTTVNLAPADIRKEGPAYDLPIAVGVLGRLSFPDLIGKEADLILPKTITLTSGISLSALVMAAETLAAARLADLRALGGQPVLAITARRATTLKARAYDGDLARVAVALKQDSGAAVAGRLHLAQDADEINYRVSIPDTAV